MVLSGPLGGGDKGFVFFSMNLLSPFWPQRSGVFGADLPILDGTGGEYQGYNWLGAGVMLLLLVALGRAAIRGRRPRPHGMARRARWSCAAVARQPHLCRPGQAARSRRETLGRHLRHVPRAGTRLLAGRLHDHAARRRGRRTAAPQRAAPLLLAAVALQIVDIRPHWVSLRRDWTDGARITAPAGAGGHHAVHRCPLFRLHARCLDQGGSAGDGPSGDPRRRPRRQHRDRPITRMVRLRAHPRPTRSSCRSWPARTGVFRREHAGHGARADSSARMQ